MSKKTLNAAASNSAMENDIVKKYGDVCIKGNDLKNHTGQIIPTTISLDIQLRGGIVEGTIISMSGVSGSGKTTLSLTIAANAQKMGKTCYYLDVEGRLNDSLLNTVKELDQSKLIIIRSSPDKLLNAEDFLNILDNIVTSDPGAFIILDSVAALCMSGSRSAEIGESRKMMDIPSQMYTVCRKLAQVIPSTKSNVIFLTHLQANPSPYGGPQEYGGNAVKYHASYRLMCMSSTEMPKDDTKKTGRESKFKILKSALGPGTGDAIFYIRYDHGYNKPKDLFELATEFAMIDRKGAWYEFSDEKNERIKLQGAESVIKHIEDNIEFATFLETQIKDMTKK